MKSTKQNDGITLEEIRKRKAVIKKQLESRKQVMSIKTQSLFTPSEELTRWDHTMNLINNGIAVYDGLMMGLRLMGKFRGYFRRRK